MGSIPTPSANIKKGKTWQDVTGSNVECAVRKYLLDYLGTNVMFAPEKKVRISNVNYVR